MNLSKQPSYEEFFGNIEEQTRETDNLISILFQQINNFFDIKGKELNPMVAMTALTVLMVTGMQTICKNRSEMKDRVNAVINMVLDGQKEES